MRCHLKNTIKHQRPSLEETITPVPAVIFDNVVCFFLDPKVEGDEDDAAYPAHDVDGK